MKMIMADPAIAKEHYKKDDEWLIRKGKQIAEQLKLEIKDDEEFKKQGQTILTGLEKDIRLYPIIAMVFEGHKAILLIKRMVGPTNPEEAMPGTIRGDFCQDSYLLANHLGRPVVNIVHCTDDPNESEREINLWFNKEEIIDWVHPQETLDFRK